MLLNVQNTKKMFHDNNKRVTRHALLELDRKVSLLISKAIDNAIRFKTVKAEDIVHISVKATGGC